MLNSEPKAILQAIQPMGHGLVIGVTNQLARKDCHIEGAHR